MNHRPIVRSLIVLCSMILIIATGGIALGASSAPNSASVVRLQNASMVLPPVPAGLPTYFSYGLSNNNTSLMPAGTPWNLRYQYLSGGANTGGGWSTWNSPPGQFAVSYINSSRTANLTPAFVYYQILQSAPHYDEYLNLNNPTTMYSYFEDFKLLMQKCAAAG